MKWLKRIGGVVVGAASGAGVIETTAPGTDPLLEAITALVTAIIGVFVVIRNEKKGTQAETT